MFPTSTKESPNTYTAGTICAAALAKEETKKHSRRRRETVCRAMNSQEMIFSFASLLYFYLPMFMENMGENYGLYRVVNEVEQKCKVRNKV